MIVTVTHTIMDGAVVRWYRPDMPLDQLLTARPAISASREGVLVNAYLHEVPEFVLALAQNIHATFQRNPNAPVQHLATHRRRGMFGPYEPVPAATCKCPAELCRCAHAEEPR
ncbi:hypothetical protein [Micromonospora sp. 4G55]|uniref:hypothetical protein n=1 Tax=Micromonospora sp. 4G55 TaxID=2806102 RepID=UPI001A57FE99|nr:hypothetical protein [Micromonospora sp. 4G55]MBM0257360.1 hypothetical protein [Micromonospora sp. 4G55]